TSTTVPSSGTTASAGAAQGTTKGTTKESPKETFMKLLVAQLEYQNPLSPMDNTQFTQQLAQFTSLEQLQSMNANLSALMNAQTTTNGLQAATLIGKQVQAQANTTQVSKQGEATPFQVTATDKAGKPVAVEESLQGIVEGVT